MIHVMFSDISDNPFTISSDRYSDQIHHLFFCFALKCSVSSNVEIEVKYKAKELVCGVAVKN